MKEGEDLIGKFVVITKTYTLDQIHNGEAPQNVIYHVFKEGEIGVVVGFDDRDSYEVYVISAKDKNGREIYQTLVRDSFQLLNEPKSIIEQIINSELGLNP